MPEIESIDAYERFTGTRLLVRNMALSLIGQGGLLVTSAVAMPMLIKGFGIGRSGMLTLAGMAIGYFSLFDLAIWRAFAKFVAEKLGAGQEETIPALFWTSLFSMVI